MLYIAGDDTYRRPLQETFILLFTDIYCAGGVCGTPLGAQEATQVPAVTMRSGVRRSSRTWPPSESCRLWNHPFPLKAAGGVLWCRVKEASRTANPRETVIQIDTLDISACGTLKMNLSAFCSISRSAPQAAEVLSRTLINRITGSERTPWKTPTGSCVDLPGGFVPFTDLLTWPEEPDSDPT